MNYFSFAMDLLYFVNFYLKWCIYVLVDKQGRFNSEQQKEGRDVEAMSEQVKKTHSEFSFDCNL